MAIIYTVFRGLEREKNQFTSPTMSIAISKPLPHNFQDKGLNDNSISGVK